MDAVAAEMPFPEDLPSGEKTLDLPYRRILIYGVTGSGKTTMAARMSELTGIPWTEVDTLTWEPGWVEAQKEIQIERIQTICDRDEWILDSAYGKWLDIPLQRVELIIGLDYPRWLSLRRLVVRTLKRIRTGEEICNGNFETWKNHLNSNGLVVWHFKSFARKRERIRKWAREGKCKVVVLRHPREFEAWVQRMRVEGVLDKHPAPDGASEDQIIEHLMRFEDEF